MIRSRLPSALGPPTLLRLALFGTLLGAGACGDGGGSGGAPEPEGEPAAAADSTGEDAAPAEVAEPEPEPPAAWSGAVHQVDYSPFDSVSVSGDLAEGQVLDMTWAYQPGVYCWFVTEGAPWAGAQVFYALSTVLSNQKTLELTVTPQAGVDVNVYAYALPTDQFWVPPEVPAASDCKALAAAGPGEAETTTLSNIHDARNWFWAVAGPEGVDSGAFEVTIKPL